MEPTDYKSLPVFRPKLSNQLVTVRNSYSCTINRTNINKTTMNINQELIQAGIQLVERVKSEVVLSLTKYIEIGFTHDAVDEPPLDREYVCFYKNTPTLEEVAKWSNDFDSSVAGNVSDEDSYGSTHDNKVFRNIRKQLIDFLTAGKIITERGRIKVWLTERPRLEFMTYDRSGDKVHNYFIPLTTLDSNQRDTIDNLIDSIL